MLKIYSIIGEHFILQRHFFLGNVMAIQIQIAETLVNRKSAGVLQIFYKPFTRG
jgi:hypothetical protein